MQVWLLATELSSYQYAIASVATLAGFLAIRQSREWLRALKRTAGSNRPAELRIAEPPAEDAWEATWKFAEACAEERRRAA